MTYSNNLKELKAAGIQVKRSDSNCPIHITFSAGWLSGQLRIPTIRMDLTTPSTYLNLMAYEVCPDFDNNFEITSYVQFLTSMVKYPDDVKELRSCGCMINFFNFISAHSVHNGQYGTLLDMISSGIYTGHGLLKRITPISVTLAPSLLPLWHLLSLLSKPGLPSVALNSRTNSCA